jgi:hypothetical protein
MIAAMNRRVSVLQLVKRSLRQVAREVKIDLKTAKKMWLPWWAVILLLVIAVWLPGLFERLGNENLFVPVWNCVAVFGFMFVLKWRLRDHLWFWITMAVFVALHILLIWLVPWGGSWVPALAIGAIDSLDFCLILWILTVVGRLAESPKAELP